MKKPSIYFLMMLFAIASVIGGCKKDEDDDDNNDTQTAVVGPADLYNYSDAFGIFAGVNTITTQTVPIVGTVEIETGTAVAAVWNTAGAASSFIAMGTVSCNTNDLTKQSNNSYVFTPTATASTGIDFSGGSDWAISGSADVPAFNFTFSTFPDNPTITSDKDEVVLANGYTFSVSGLGSADSVLYILASGDSYVEKRVAGFVNTVTFTASELSTLDASAYGLIQVTPYNITSASPNGKKYYFVNQVTVSDFAEFK